jgi:hypothetical protein
MHTTHAAVNSAPTALSAAAQGQLHMKMFGDHPIFGNLISGFVG